MLTKVINLICFSLIWLGLAGYPGDTLGFVSMSTVLVLTLLISLKLELLPARSLIKINSVYYSLWLIKEIIFSTINVIKIVWRKNLAIIPVMKPVKSIQQTDIGIMIYANSITLTPGTVTLSTYGDNLMVHALDIGIMEDLEQGKMDQMVSKIVK